MIGQGKYFLEDPTGSVELDLSQAVIDFNTEGFFVHELEYLCLLSRLFIQAFLLNTASYWQKVKISNSSLEVIYW